MNKADLFYKPLIKEAWGITKKYYWTILVFMTITISVSMVLSQDPKQHQNILLSIVSIVASIMFGFWSKRLAVWVADNREFKFINIFEGFSNFKNYLITTLIYGLIVLGGFILLIVPGIIFSLKYFMAPYYAIDKGMNYKDALKASANATNGYKKNVFVLGFLLLLFALSIFLMAWFFSLLAFKMGIFIIASLLLLAVLVLIVIPVGYVISGLLYTRLSSNTEGSVVADNVITQPVAESNNVPEATVVV